MPLPPGTRYCGGRGTRDFYCLPYDGPRRMLVDAAVEQRGHRERERLAEVRRRREDLRVDRARQDDRRRSEGAEPRSGEEPERGAPADLAGARPLHPEHARHARRSRCGRARVRAGARGVQGLRGQLRFHADHAHRQRRPRSAQNAPQDANGRLALQWPHPGEERCGRLRAHRRPAAHPAGRGKAGLPRTGAGARQQAQSRRHEGPGGEPEEQLWRQQDRPVVAHAGIAGDGHLRAQEALGFLRRRRTDSNRHTPADTETLRLSTSPAIGIFTSRSHVSRVRRRMPSPSAPSTQAIESGRSASNSVFSPRSSAPTIQRLRSLSSPSVCARVVTLREGVAPAAPLATFDTAGVMPAARPLGAIAGLAPAAFATRRQAPRLCGSVTPSSTRTSGCSTALSTSSRSSPSDFTVTRATTPWWRAPLSKPSRRFVGTRIRRTPWRSASAARSRARTSLRVSSRKISTTEAGSARRRASTTWNPKTTLGSRSRVIAVSRHEVHLALVDVDAHQLHGQSVGEAEALLRALAEKHVARAVVLEVVAAELRDVHQAVDEIVVERDE